MLALAPVIARVVGLSFDPGELCAFICLHDLPELGMKYDITAQEQVEDRAAKQRKDDLEASAIVRLAEEYGGWLLSWFEEYEEQVTDITRFVKWLDKYEASRHIYEINLYSEVPLLNFSINTGRLVDAAIKFPQMKRFTLEHLDGELRPIWERNNKLPEFLELRKKLQ
jgi:hypothetical protein